MSEKLAKKKSEELVDAVAPEVDFEDVENDGKGFLELQLHTREANRFFESECNVRTYLRRYCIFLITFSCLPMFYSIIYCGPLELELMDVRLVNPAFNKYDTSRQCTSVTKALQKGVITLIIFYALKVYNKLYLSSLYLCLLFYFGLEVRNVKMELGKNRIAVTDQERMFHSIESGFLVFQILLISPFLVGGYILLRHAHRKATATERRQQQEIREEDARLLKKRMKVEKTRLDKLKKGEVEKIEVEKAQLKKEERAEVEYLKRKACYEKNELQRKKDDRERRMEREKEREKIEKEKAEEDKA